MGEINASWSENVKGRDRLEDLGINGKTILKCVLAVYSCGPV
jgi:hypothetical protein